MDGSTASRIKICDFGFAKTWSAGSPMMHSSIGTPVYMSPQVKLRGERVGLIPNSKL
jgi:serine/threonine protein kinase